MVAYSLTTLNVHPINNINFYRKQNEVIFKSLLTKGEEICKTAIYKDGQKLILMFYTVTVHLVKSDATAIRREILLVR